MNKFAKGALYGILTLAAAVGFLLSASVHVAALMGHQLFTGAERLHIGIFIVAFPAIIIAQKTTYNMEMRKRDLWKIVLSGCPPWMRHFALFLFAYAILNFALFLVGMVSSPPTPATGEMSPATLRGFSGHWMIFYWGALSVFVSVTRLKHQIGKTCSNCHTRVSPFNKFCPNCGTAIV